MAKFFIVSVLIAIATADNPKGPLTKDFQNWLKKNNYNVDAFVRSDIGDYASYGGKIESSDQVKNQPIIFVHGNSDSALGSGQSGMTGWTNSIKYFESKGYTSAELYATTWGPANLLLSSVQTHSCAYVQQLRNFTKAVLAYTGAKKVDVIGHSMGVTLARKFIQGGQLAEPSGYKCDLGPPMTDKVDTYLGIAGGNRGLTNCEVTPEIPACNPINGFFAGVCPIGICPGNVKGMAKVLAQMNDNPGSEGEYVYSFWSRVDEVIQYGDLVWGYPTSAIPGQNGQKVSYTLGHIGLKDQTEAWQYDAVVNHKV